MRIFNLFRNIHLLVISLFIILFVGLVIPIDGIFIPLVGAGLLLLIGISIKSPFPILIFIIFLTPLGFFTTFSGATINRYLILFLLFSTIFYIIRNRIKFSLDKPGIYLGIWIIFALISYFWAGTTYRLVENIFGYISSFVLLFSTSFLVNSKKKLQQVISAFLIGQLCFIIIYLLFGEINNRGFFLPTIGVSQLSEYGTWIGLIIACYIPIIFYSKKYQRLFAILVLISLIYLFFVTALRRTILTTGFVVFVLLLSPKKIPWKQFILACFLFVFLWIVWEPIISNLPENISTRFSIDQVITSGGSGRLYLYRIAYDLWLTSPVFGSGLGTYTHYAEAFYRGAGVPHNLFLEVLCETGIIGLIFWCTGFFQIFWNTLKTFRHAKYFPDKILTSIPLSLMGYMFAVGMVGSLQNWRPLWFAMGLGIAVMKIYNSKPRLSINSENLQLD